MKDRIGRKPILVKPSADVIGRRIEVEPDVRGHKEVVQGILALFVEPCVIAKEEKASAPADELPERRVLRAAQDRPGVHDDGDAGVAESPVIQRVRKDGVEPELTQEDGQPPEHPGRILPETLEVRLRPVEVAFLVEHDAGRRGGHARALRGADHLDGDGGEERKRKPGGAKQLSLPARRHARRPQPYPLGHQPDRRKLKNEKHQRHVPRYVPGEESKDASRRLFREGRGEQRREERGDFRLFGSFPVTREEHHRDEVRQSDRHKIDHRESKPAPAPLAAQREDREQRRNERHIEIETRVGGAELEPPADARADELRHIERPVMPQHAGGG